MVIKKWSARHYHSYSYRAVTLLFYISHHCLSMHLRTVGQVHTASQFTQLMSSVLK